MQGLELLQLASLDKAMLNSEEIKPAARDKTMLNSEKIKLVVIAIITLYLSEGIRTLVSQSIRRKFC